LLHLRARTFAPVTDSAGKPLIDLSKPADGGAEPYATMAERAAHAILDGHAAAASTPDGFLPPTTDRKDTDATAGRRGLLFGIWESKSLALTFLPGPGL
jgi:hypothetical protein